MKLLHKYIDYKHGTGRMTFIPEEGEDLWHVYNLITHGDVVRCATLRKVVTESATGKLLYYLFEINYYDYIARLFLILLFRFNKCTES